MECRLYSSFWWTMSLTLSNLHLFPNPVSNSTNLLIWLQYFVSKIKISVSGDLTNIVVLSGYVPFTCIQWRTIRVSASSCHEKRGSVENTSTLFPSWLVSDGTSLRKNYRQIDPEELAHMYRFVKLSHAPWDLVPNEATDHIEWRVKGLPTFLVRGLHEKWNSLCIYLFLKILL